MDTVNVFTYFDGEWDESGNYCRYSVCGLILPVDCTYDGLIELIATQLGKDAEKHQITVHYQSAMHTPRICISTDYSLAFYLDLKKGETDKRSYPLCVDTSALEQNMAGDQGEALHDDLVIDACNHLTLDQHATSRDFHFREDLPDSIQTLEEMGNELAEFIKFPVDEVVGGPAAVISRPNTDEVAIGSVFMDKELLITTVSLFAIKNHFQYNVMKSDTKIYTVKCVEGSCNWTLRATATGCSGNFKIRKMDKIHRCSIDVVLGGHRQASTLVIASCIKYRFLSCKRIYTPGDIIDDMQETYGVTISYDKAWRARERAIMMIRGNPVESYANLPAYMHMLEVTNPGSYTRIETDDDNRFLFSFVALGASIAGWRHCKPVIVVDGTFLTSRYRGTLFTACTQDANNNIFILAFGVGDGENNNAWEWFLLRLREAYGVREELCIVSDRHGSIEHAVDRVFPHALHGACTYHLLQNVKKKFGKKAKGVRKPFNAAARAYTKTKFEKHMRKVDEIHDEIRGYLEGVGYEKWTRSYMTTNRYSTMTSNIVELVNASIKHAKKYPIEALFECLRHTVQKWFFQNLSDAKSTFTRLSSRYNAMLNERVKSSMQMRVHPSSDILYQVNDGATPYVVNMEDKTCSCRMFQLDQLPCPHAIAVISKRNYLFSDYCSTYFTKEKYIEAYQGTIYPLGNKDEWCVPEEVTRRLVLPPMSKRGPGRPKENRFKSSIECKKTTRCGRCDGYGHNTRTCRNPEPVVEKCKKKLKRSHPMVDVGRDDGPSR